MRQIKFRAWIKNKEKMYNNVGFCPINNRIIIDFSQCGSISFEKTDDVNLMQFTGLFDKNGKEIYEGDVVKILYTDWISCSGCHETPSEHMNALAKTKVVLWSFNGFYVSHAVDGNSESMEPGKSGFIEVIGNIYENQELLK